jgi:hypothetical protein
MGVVHHQAGPILLAQHHDLRKPREVAPHAVQAVDDDQLSLVLGNARQHVVQVFHIVVTETLGVAPGKARAVHDACMIVFVEQDDVAASHKGTDGSEIRLHAGGEYQRGFLANPLRQLMLQLLVQFQRPVEEARSGARGSKAFHRVDGGLPDAGVGSQAQVVVGAAHDEAVPVENRLVPFALTHRYEVRIRTVLDGFPGLGVSERLFENIHVTLP